MNNSNTETIIRDTLIYFGLAAAVSTILKMAFKRKDFNVFLHALSLTLGWLASKFIMGYMDSMRGSTYEN